MTSQDHPPAPVPGIAPAEFLRALTTRTAVRAYTDTSITLETVNALLEGMQAAPSAGNTQAWSFIVIREPRNIRRLRAFAPGVIGHPALVVLACSDDSRGPEYPSEKQVRTLCVAMAVQNLLLTAHAHGLGACPVHSFAPEPLRLLFDLPPYLQPVLLVPIGIPAHQRSPSSRRASDEVISYETHGQREPVSHGAPRGATTT
ncbi:nitroreductase family protein [Streptomyces rimosus]|uniref:nitroreductase family protein n=1 Tax=Streptomyces rimosus TaxID=1927 RepID=UPI0007C54E77|nr:nitroreductase family protein [Streptomyces rimosus]